MKVLIHSTASGHFYKGSGIWGPEPEEGMPFLDILAASRECQANHWENVEVFLSFREPRYDIAVPVVRDQLCLEKPG